uniref:Uncharacterized protein n=1 Tax=Timema shepardi TaxID=629360 RepID=A0A7R9FZ53_TIMSH|nr:unnamed protein product [Timema shepardi]
MSGNQLMGVQQLRASTTQPQPLHDRTPSQDQLITLHGHTTLIVQKIKECRNTQSVFDACVLNNLNLERPPFDYYNKVRVHVSSRPKPTIKPDVFPDPTPKLPDDYPREPAKYGSRFHWLN